MRSPFPRLRASAQPDSPDALNERDEATGKTVRVPTRVSRSPGLDDDEDEVVWATPEAAEQWDARRWSP